MPNCIFLQNIILGWCIAVRMLVLTNRHTIATLSCMILRTIRHDTHKLFETMYHRMTHGQSYMSLDDLCVLIIAYNKQ